MFGRASILKFSGWTPVAFGRASGGAIPPDLTEGPVDGLNKSVSVGIMYTITPTLLLDGTVGFNYVTPEALHVLWERTSDWTTCSFRAPTIRTTSPTAACRSSGSRGIRPLATRGARGRKRWHDNQRRYNANLRGSRERMGSGSGSILARAHEPLADEAGGGPRGDFAYSAGTTESSTVRRRISTMRSRRSSGVALVRRQSGRSRIAADDARVAAGVLCARPVAGDADLTLTWACAPRTTRLSPGRTPGSHWTTSRPTRCGLAALARFTDVAGTS